MGLSGQQVMIAIIIAVISLIGMTEAIYLFHANGVHGTNLVMAITGFGCIVLGGNVLSLMLHRRE